MAETPREYKKRIDETREQRRKNKDKLIKEIDKYELVDDSYKSRTKREILDNFEKNEKADKTNELYVKIGQELASIDLKYKELEDLRLRLDLKNREKLENIKELRGYAMTGQDETTLKIQRAYIKKLENTITNLDNEIQEIEKEINNRENEIKEIEDTYGKRIEKKETESTFDIQETENNNQEENGENTEKNKDEELDTIETYRKKTIKKIWEINKTRGEILKLLDEGTGIDDNIKERIQGEISKIFFDYYHEKEDNLKMRLANLIGIREIRYGENYDNVNKYYKNIGGKPIYETAKDGKYYIMWGNKQIGKGFNDIENLLEIGGKPAFRAKKQGKYYIIRGNEQYSEGFDYIGEIKGIGGKPTFWVKKNGKYYVFRGNEQIGGDFDNEYRIQSMKEIGGKPCFTAKKNGELYQMLGNKQICKGFENINNLQEIGGKPCFQAKKNGKECVVRGDKELGGWFDRTEKLTEVGGKPIFKATKQGKSCVFRGDRQYTGYFDNIREIYTDIGGKPLIEVGIDGGECIIQGKEKQSEIYRGIRNIQEIGGKLAYRASDYNHKYCVMRGGEQQGEWFDEIEYFQEIGGKPAFKAKKDENWIVMRGKEQIGEEYEKIWNLLEIGGKPAFEAKKEGKQRIMRGNEQYCDLYDSIAIKEEILGKIVYKVNEDGKEFIMRGDKKCGKTYEEFSEIRETGGEPIFIARKNHKEYIVQGDKQFGKVYEDINFAGKIGGKQVFNAYKNYTYYIIRGNEQLIGGFDNIGDIKEIGGKPAFIAKKKEKYYIIRGNRQIGKGIDYIGDLYDIGGEPVFIAEKDREKCVIWGDRQATKRYDDIEVKDLQNLENGRLTLIATKYCKAKIITLYKKMNIKPKYKTNTEEISKPEGESDQLDTQRGIREKLMHQRYEKLLNLNELLSYIKNNKILDNEALKQLEEKALESYYDNYEKAKEDKDFQAADNEYRKLKSLKRKHKKLDQELATKEGENNENLEKVDKRIYEIADEIENIGGSFFKRNKLNKIKEERDKLEARRKNIIILQAEEYKLRNEIKKQEKLYGPKINSDKLRGKSDEELKKYLNQGELTQIKTLKEYKEKQARIRENIEKLISFIKQLDLGIDEEIKGEILKIIEENLKGSIKTKEGEDLLTMLNDTEKYLNENLNDFIKKLKGIKAKIKECEEQVKILEGKKETASYEELLKINDKIFEIKQGEIEIKNEYDETKKTINELLNKYDGSDIESML